MLRKTKSGKIIVIEDCKSLNKLLCLMLQDKYSVIGTKSAMDAFSWLQADFIPDLILIDYNLPDINGIEFARNLKSNSLYNGIPIIFLSGEDSEDLITQMLRYGGFMKKPFALDELLYEVNSVINVKTGQLTH